MNKLNKYYTSACGLSNGNFLDPLGFEGTKNFEEADVIIFGGGADIDPSTYGEEPSKSTHPSKEKEKEEKEDFHKAKKLGKFMVGICRGHQLITALAGGKLIQDVSGHGGNGHDMTTFDGLKVQTNSMHHQMANPYTMDSHDYQILAWSTKRRSTKYLGAKDKRVYLPWDFKEIESIYFPKLRALGFQFHPRLN